MDCEYTMLFVTPFEILLPDDDNFDMMAVELARLKDAYCWTYRDCMGAA